MGSLSSWFNNVYCVHEIRRGGLHCIIFKLFRRVYLVLVFRSGRSDKFLLNPEIRSGKCLRLLRYQSYPVAPGPGWERLRRGSWCSFKSVTLPPDNADTATGVPPIRVAHFLSTNTLPFGINWVDIYHFVFCTQQNPRILQENADTSRSCRGPHLSHQ